MIKSAAYCLTLIFIIGSILLTSCEIEKERGILKGDVVGIVNQLNQYDYPENGKPGTSITVSNTHFSKSAVADNNGFYRITDVPYGVYGIHVEYPGYIHVNPKSFTHVGGKSPTMQNVEMIQIPDFNIFLDSFLIKKYKIIYFGKIWNISQKPMSSFTFRCFMSVRADVSKDNYEETIDAYSSTIEDNNITIESTSFFNELNILKNDTVYFIIYPAAPVYSTNLGNPSNILKFIVPR